MEPERRLRGQIDLVKAAAKKEANIVMTMIPPRGGQGERAAEVIRKSYSAHIVPVMVCHRACYGHALTAGQSVQEFEPNGKASQEIMGLYKWVRRAVGV
jgi:chromosome partitioning protein